MTLHAWDFKNKYQVQCTNVMVFFFRHKKSFLGVLFSLQKIFIVPSSPSQKEIPFARVNHNKYMVTDRVAYIGMDLCMF